MEAVLRKKYKEVFYLKPNDLKFKPLDELFHSFVPFLKTMPWFVLFPMAFLFSLGIVFFLGARAVWLVSLFQYGF